MKKNILLLFLAVSVAINGVVGQGRDTSNVFQQADTSKLAQPYTEPDKYKTRLLPSMIIPGILIGYGLTTIKDNGLYSSYEAQKDVKRVFKGRQSRIDDFLIYSPYIEFAALTLFKVRCKNDLVNTGLLILKSQLIMAAIVFPMKQLTSQMRPYAHDSLLTAKRLDENLDVEAFKAQYKKDKPNAFHSLPSGHTAQAFCAATVVYREYRHKSPWYGIGAYTLASTVGLYRMINNKHWMSDVITGAGIGILSANIAYATHRHKWGRKEVCSIFPTFDGRNKGLAMVYKF